MAASRSDCASLLIFCGSRPLFGGHGRISQDKLSFRFSDIIYEDTCI